MNHTRHLSKVQPLLLHYFQYRKVYYLRRSEQSLLPKIGLMGWMFCWICSKFTRNVISTTSIDFLLFFFYQGLFFDLLSLYTFNITFYQFHVTGLFLYPSKKHPNMILKKSELISKSKQLTNILTNGKLVRNELFYQKSVTRATQTQYFWIPLMNLFSRIY